MKKSKKLIMDDLKNHYNGKVDVDEVLGHCQMYRDGDITVRRLCKEANILLIIAIILFILMFLGFFFGFNFIKVNEKDDLEMENLSKKDTEYMYQYCDRVDRDVIYKLSLSEDEYILIFTGKDVQEDSYDRYYFYKAFLINQDIECKVMFNDSSHSVKNGDFSLLSELDDEESMEVTIDVIYGGDTKHFVLDLYK